MPIIGVVAIMGGVVLMYLGFSGTSIGELMRTVFGSK